MISLNTQPAEKPHYEADGSVVVHSIWNTFQGEGPLVGLPATFIRLAGCNLDCPACDTDYTSNRETMLPLDIINYIHNLNAGFNFQHGRLVVITGGEPFRQFIGPLVMELISHEFVVQIETNGTLFLPQLPYNHPDLIIVCSPKTTGVHPKLVEYVDAWKYVIEAGKVDPVDGLPTVALHMNSRPFRCDKRLRGRIYVQPMDAGDGEGNADLTAANVEVALKSCAMFGYRFCLQVHKIIGVP